MMPGAFSLAFSRSYYDVRKDKARAASVTWRYLQVL